MIVGPRNAVVSQLLGTAHDWLMDMSPWVAVGSLTWDSICHDYPELWVEKIHDYVHEEEI